MNLDEISNEEKSFLTLQGIKFNFANEYSDIVAASSIIGKSSHRRAMLKENIKYLQQDMRHFLNQGFSNSDPDIIAAKDLYNKLYQLKGTL
jgi:hypothetical protein